MANVQLSAPIGLAGVKTDISRYGGGMELVRVHAKSTDPGRAWAFATDGRMLACVNGCTSDVIGAVNVPTALARTAAKPKTERDGITVCVADDGATASRFAIGKTEKIREDARFPPFADVIPSHDVSALKDGEAFVCLTFDAAKLATLAEAIGSGGAVSVVARVSKVGDTGRHYGQCVKPMSVVSADPQSPRGVGLLMPCSMSPDPFTVAAGLCDDARRNA